MYNAWRFNSFLAHSGIGFKRKTYVVNDDFGFYIEFASWILYVRRECLTAKRHLKFYSEDIDKIQPCLPVDETSFVDGMQPNFTSVINI